MPTDGKDPETDGEAVKFVAALDAIAVRCGKLPVLDRQSADDALGYGSDGVPAAGAAATRMDDTPRS